MELEVLFEDEDVLVCYKPAGVATQTAKMTEPDMVSMIRNYRVAKGESDYRGDPPSGSAGRGSIGLLQKCGGSSHSWQRIKGKAVCQILLRHRDQREYTGDRRFGRLCCKRWEKEPCHGGCGEVTQEGKESALSYEVVKRLDDRSLLDIHLDTGRFPDPRTTGKPYGTDLRRCQIRWQPYRRTALSLLLPPAVYASGQRGGHGFFHQASWQRVR